MLFSYDNVAEFRTAVLPNPFDVFRQFRGQRATDLSELFVGMNILPLHTAVAQSRDGSILGQIMLSGA